MVLHIPAQDLTIAFACNLQNIDREPYVKQLYQAVTDRSWDIPVYTRDKFDAALYRGMSETFNYGAVAFERSTRSVPSDPSAAAKAFAYFNKFVNLDQLRADFDATVAAINDGRHPVSGTPLVKVGSQMAQVLLKKYGRERRDSYNSGGAISFFADYIAMYKKEARYPAELRFNESFEKLVEKWNSDWTRTWNNYTQRFDFTAGSDLKNIDQTLRPLFAGAEVYPNLINQLLDIRLQFEKKKDWGLAADASRLAAELYPQSDRATAFYAISLALIGKKDEARTTLRRAVGINPRGIGSPVALNQIALAIANTDKFSAAIDWLEISTEIYPGDANLITTLGEFYQKGGRTEQAVEAYKRALAIDPNFEKAKSALKSLP